MTDHDALGDMHPPLGPLAASPPADQDILERLLEGRVDPASAPPGYGGLARALAAATAPATPEDLAGEQSAMATFEAVMPSHPPILVPRRSAVPRKVSPLKAVAAALVAVLSIGGIAAATGLLPGHTSPAADRAPATTGADAAAHGLGDAAAADTGGSARAGSTNGRRRESAVGPDATGAARAGLCRAWQAGKGADHGRRADSVAFQALVDAAGGADKVAAYCEDVLAGSNAGAHGQGQGSRPSGSPPRSDPPADPGPPAGTGPGGHGRGGPPTTTG